MLKVEGLVVPIRIDEDGVARVGRTDVPIESVIEAFHGGESPQEIVEQYPVLKLADVYAVIAYYLQARAEVDAYLEQRRERAVEIEREVEKVGGDLRKLPPGVFVDTVRSADWEPTSAEDYMEAVRIAFGLEAGLLARELAQRGHEQFPDDEELAKAVRILAPATVVETDTEAKPSLKDTIQWFRDHKGEYKGHWVAVNAGRLIGAYRTHDELFEALGEYASDPDTLITRVN